MRKYIIYCLMVVLLVGLVPVGASAKEGGIYEVVIYPNGKGVRTLRTLGADKDGLVLGDVKLTYDVDYENDIISINFEKEVFIDDVVSNGNTIHKKIYFDSIGEIEVNEELQTSGFMAGGVSEIILQYGEVENVESIVLMSSNDDFSGGLLDGLPVKVNKSTRSYTSESITDNNLSTFEFFAYSNDNRSISIADFGLVRVDSFRIKKKAERIRISFSYNGEIVKRYVDSDVKDYVETEGFLCDSIVIWGFDLNANNYVYEFNVYGENSDVKDLTYSINNNNIILTWKNPTNFDNLEAIKIYRNDELVETTLGESFSEYLTVGGTYKYKVSTVVNGKESPGVYIEVEIEGPPEDVKNLNYTIDDNNNITFTWVNPTDINFKEVNIYRDGKLIKTTTDTSFTEVLSPGTYKYKITTTSITGKESPGITLDNIKIEYKSSPTVVKGIRMLNKTATGGLLTWTPNPAYENVSKYVIYLNGKKHGEIEAPPYVLEGLEEGQVYTISVQAINNYGISEPPSTLTYIPQKPELQDTINVGDVFSNVNTLFANMWPLLALVFAIILSPKIYHLIKSNVT